MEISVTSVCDGVGRSLGSVASRGVSRHLKIDAVATGAAKEDVRFVVPRFPRN